MAETLGGDARIIVEIAWGANLLADPDTWSWTDITGDVFYGGGRRVSISLGRADEASAAQPATCAMTLDNTAGLYSLGPQSANWPHVRRNTPVRVRVDPGTGAIVLCLGFADGFTPRWGVAGRNAAVELTASGALRRLIQGGAPLQSSFRRSSLALPSMVAYWPCEDGADATSIASGIASGSPMGFYGAGPEFATSDAFACSDELPRLDGSAWLGPVTTYTDTGHTQVRALISFPAAGSPDSSVLFRVHTTGTSDLWELRYKTGSSPTGSLNIRGWGAGVVLIDQTVTFEVDGARGQYGIQLAQNGSDVDYSIDELVVGDTGSTGFSATLAGRTVGVVYQVEVNTDGVHEDLVLGHLTVQNAITDEDVQIAALNAHTGEVPADRITRLCTENHLSATIMGNSILGDVATTACGYQRVDTLVSLLRAAEVVEQGVLHDGAGNGFTLVTRRRHENQDPFLTLDVAEGDLAGDLHPVDDDQRNVNQAVATRTNASSYTYTDTDGPLGTAVIGTYATSVTVSNDSDGEIAHYASWVVHLGTVEGYRYPELDLDLTHSPHLIRQWLTAILGGRIDVVGIESVLDQHPAGTISLALAGYSQEIDQHRWLVSANCSPYAPWLIGVWAQDTADTNPLVLRFDTDGSTLVEAVEVGATSLTVATPTGPVWTTNADDFPLEVDLDGIEVAVTTITGAGSPQTFTVDGSTVTVQRPAGSSVSVITPPLGL